MPRLEDGYTILLPSPTDMPFLLRFALEGMRELDTHHCDQVVVIADGLGEGGGEGLRTVIADFADRRVELIGLPALAGMVVHGFGRRFLEGGSTANWAHWATIVAGTARAKHEYIFLHDADAFFLEPGGLERQFRDCRDREMLTLGVTPRWDPYFKEIGYMIPGTWELMYSTRWARCRPPAGLKGGMRQAADGVREFDTMLHAQYLDYGSGRVGVMGSPPRFVHFSGTITTYRVFRDRSVGTVADELFRILLLAVLESLVPAKDGVRVVPRVEELSVGLTDPGAPVTYCFEAAPREYANFRAMVDEMCEAPVFAGERSDRIQQLLRPFDEHFAEALAAYRGDGPAEPAQVRMRWHGLG
jgi:hypothetical protein